MREKILGHFGERIKMDMVSKKHGLVIYVGYEDEAVKWL